jgi:taurine dioxygenase
MASINALPKCTGVEVSGVDLRFPIEPAFRAWMNDLFDHHGLVILRDVELDEHQQVELTETLGRTSPQGGNMKKGRKAMYVSNTRADGVIPLGEILFHFDHSYFELPLKALSLYGIAVTKTGGETLFSNSTEVYKSLPDRLKARIADLKVRHVFDYSGDQVSDHRQKAIELSPNASWAVHPLVWRHPRTGEPMLLVSRLTSDRIMELPDAESEALLEELFPYVEDPAYIYAHRWRARDYVVWDNLLYQHARAPFDSKEPRELRRVPIANEKLKLPPESSAPVAPT